MSEEIKGWKLVPVEPTREMKRAFIFEHNSPFNPSDRLMCNAYKAMLAAAPTPPAPETPTLAELDSLLERYWDAAYAEGKEGRAHDTFDGVAARTLAELHRVFKFRSAPEPDYQHSDGKAVDAFALKMKNKLSNKRAEGYDGWEDECTQEYLSEQLREHVGKGDPVDVANFAMMLGQRGQRITPPAPEPISTGSMEPVAEAYSVAGVEGTTCQLTSYVPFGTKFHSAEQLATLQAKLENANCALGEHPDADIDLAQRISELRDESRGHFHTETKLQSKLEQAEKDVEELLTLIGVIDESTALPYTHLRVKIRKVLAKHEVKSS